MSEDLPSARKPRCYYEFGAYRLDPEKCLLWFNGELVSLEPKVTKTLAVLVKARGHLIGKEDLIWQVWDGIAVTDDSLTRNISVLRKTLGRHFDGDVIKNIPKRGYLFTPSVKEHQEDENILIFDATESDERSHISKDSSSRGDLDEDKGAPRSRPTRHPYIVFSFFAILFIAAAGLVSWWYFTAWPLPKIIKYTQLTNDGLDKPHTIFTDGVHIYFQEVVSGKPVIAEVPINGGEIVHISTPFQNPFLVGLFPGTADLLVADVRSAGHTLWKIPVPGGSAQPLKTPLGTDTVWSPDGKRAAFTKNEQHTLVVADADGSSAKDLFSVSPGWISFPRWSPNREVIRFCVFNPDLGGGNGTYELWEIRSDGSHPHPLLTGLRKEAQTQIGSWTPDGANYVFNVLQNGQSDLWSLHENTYWFTNLHNNPKRISNAPISFFAPVVSPDGKRIFAFGKQNHGELMRYDSNTHLFLPYLSGISAGGLSFSPDGGWIAYIAYPDFTLWRSKVDGGETVQLTFAPIQADSPHWSPDGERIAYRAALPGFRKKIFVISRNGGIPQEISSQESEEEGVPTWSADGKSLLYGELRWHPDKIALHIVNLETGAISTVPGSETLWTPRWSPDGRYIVALTHDSDGLMLYDFHSHKWTILARHIVGLNEPCWSRDGTYIYVDTTSNKPAIYRIGLHGKKLEKVVSLEEFPRAQDFGNWLGLTPDDSLLLLRDARQLEIYALDVEWPSH